MNSEASSAIHLTRQGTDAIELASLDSSSIHRHVHTSSTNIDESQTDVSIAGNENDSETPVNVQELPPVDIGWRAWTFCFSGCMLETLVWGFGLRYQLAFMLYIFARIESSKLYL